MRSTPRILILVNEYPPDVVAGTAMATYHLSHHLAKNGYDVHVAVTMRKNGTPEKESGDIQVYRFGITDVKGTRMLQRLYHFYRLAAELSPDIIQGQAISCGMLSALVGKWIKKPSITHIQGYDLYKANPIRMATEVRIAGRSASVVFAATEDLQKKAEKIFQRNDVQLMTAGLDIEEIQPQDIQRVREECLSHGHGKKLLFLGQLIGRKGLPYLIKAMKIIRERMPDSHLYLIGRGDEEKSLRETVSEQGLSDAVHFLGFRSRRDFYAYMNVVDLFVLPSLEEVFGIVLLEAMSQGLPVVATDVQGIPSIVKDGVNGYLVPPGNEKALASKILSLLENHGLARQMGERNRRHSAQYRWDRLADRYMEIYERMCARNANGRDE